MECGTGTPANVGGLSLFKKNISIHCFIEQQNSLIYFLFFLHGEDKNQEGDVTCLRKSERRMMISLQISNLCSWPCYHLLWYWFFKHSTYSAAFYHGGNVFQYNFYLFCKTTYFGGSQKVLSANNAECPLSSAEEPNILIPFSSTRMASGSWEHKCFTIMN